MLADIEAGKVGTVIVKDMSRLGRNYLQVGFYTEMLFPQKGVRFIAVNDNVDSANGGMDNDFIARALLKDAPVILLDEATASLDVDNETEIQNAISRLVKGKTVLIIAHRMRTVEAADNIVVLSDGIVAENGTHEELMKENGLYHRLVDLQTASANWKLSV